MSDFAWRRPWLLALLFVAISGWKTTDEAEFRILAAAPFQNTLPPDHQFLFGSPLTFFIASYYQHHGVVPGAAFYIVQAVGAAVFVLGVTVAFGALERDARHAATVVLLTSPLLFVLTAFVGKSDAYLVGFFLLLSASTSAATVALLAGLMALCHAEMAAAMLIVYLCIGRRPWRPIVAGLVCGELAVVVYTHLLLSATPDSRLTYALAHAAGLLEIAGRHPILHLAGTFGAFWIYVLTRQRLTPGMAIGAAVALGLALITSDFTRVFVIVSAPLMVQVAREVAVDLVDRGGIAIGRARIGIRALWPLLFLQFHLAGPKLFWLRGTEFVIGR